MTAPALEAAFTLDVGRGAQAFQLEAELALEQGVLVLFGPSGSGKSLSLQALAGLVRPSAGRIVVRGTELFDAAAGLHCAAHRRRVGYVPQNHALFPFCDVTANVLFGLPRAERRRDHPRVKALMAELRLEHLAGAQPADLSGGERQRVALARALAVEPQLLLLDEPFASIDADGRAEVREVLRSTLARHGMPAVFVTHDRDEAAALGDAVVRFERGRTVGTCAPHDLAAPHRLRLRGEVHRTSEAGEEGRSVLRLGDVVLEAPREALEGLSGSIELDLRIPPTDPQES